MARVTVEDCAKYEPNRFKLVLEAAKRARRLTTGAAEPCIDVENDKPTVVALREIAAGYRFNEEETPVAEEHNVATRSVFGNHSAFSDM